MDLFTKVANLVTHDEFASYFTQAMVDRSTLIKSGIATADPAINAVLEAAGTSGNFVNLPFFNALSKGEAEPIKDDGTALTVKNITAEKDVAAILRRGVAFGAADLAGMIAGADPMQAIAAGLADWWNAEKQTRLVAVLEGLFHKATNSGGDTTDGVLVSHVFGAAATALTADAILDAAQVLGDHKGEIAAYAMNSATETYLQKLNTSYMFRPSDTPARLTTFNGRTVIVDDNIADGVIYLFGPGSVAMNIGKVTQPFETFREELKSQGGIISRDASICHVRGAAWNAASLVNPDNAKLGTAANYRLVYPHKLVRVAKLVSSIAA